jgi:hypothetical protein
MARRLEGHWRIYQISTDRDAKEHDPYVPSGSSGHAVDQEAWGGVSLDRKLQLIAIDARVEWRKMGLEDIDEVFEDA